MEEMRDRAAREALEADKHNSHGTVPAGLRRWAEARVKAKVNWRAQLKSTLGRAVQSRQGMVVGKARGKAWHPSNVPFRRGSRPGVLHPTKVRARPQVALVIDTSGSMRSADLDAAMSEAVGIVAEAGSVMLIPTDAATGTIRHVRQGSRNELRKMALEGGGGTDMGAGVEAAAEAGATTVVVLTDGFTPWPAEKPAKLSNVVVGVIDQPEYSPPPTPEWAKTVVIKTDD